MNWGQTPAIVSAIAAMLAAIFSGLLLLKSRRADKEAYKSRLGRLKQTLEVDKWILENPPSIGFDHAPKPDLGLEQLKEVLATQHLLPQEVVIHVHAARDALLEVDRTITETDDSTMAQAVQFRQRFPQIKVKALSALNEALKAIDDVARLREKG